MKQETANSRKVILEVICSLLMLLFLYASVTKLLDLQTFRHDMLNQPFPKWFAHILVWWVPTLEIALTIGLVIEGTRRYALWGSLILMFLFTLYTSLALAHAFRYVPCSCGGIIKRLNWRQHFALNLAFTVLAFSGIRLHKKTQQRSSNDIQSKKMSFS